MRDYYSCSGAIVHKLRSNIVLQSISAEIDMSELNFSEEVCSRAMMMWMKMWSWSWYLGREWVRMYLSKPFRMLSYLESIDKQLRKRCSFVSRSCQNPELNFANYWTSQSSYQELAKLANPTWWVGMRRKRIYLIHGRLDGMRLPSELASVLRKLAWINFFVSWLSRSLGIEIQMLERRCWSCDGDYCSSWKDKVEALMKTFENTLEAPDKAQNCW